MEIISINVNIFCHLKERGSPIVGVANIFTQHFVWTHTWKERIYYLITKFFLQGANVQETILPILGIENLNNLLFCLCAGHNLTTTTMMTRVKTIKSFFQDIQNSLNLFPILWFSWSFRGYLRSEDTQIQNHIYHSEILHSQSFQLLIRGSQ